MCCEQTALHADWLWRCSLEGALGRQWQDSKGHNVCYSSPGGTSPEKNHQLVTVTLIMNLAQFQLEGSGRKLLQRLD